MRKGKIDNYKDFKINLIFGKDCKNMKKSIIISAIIVLFILGTVIGIILMKNFAGEKNDNTQIAEQNQEEIYDECTDEYEEI